MMIIGTQPRNWEFFFADDKSSGTKLKTDMDWWLKDKGFQDLVKLEWGNYHPLGWGGLVLKQKIKFIKQKIRQWVIWN